MKVLFLIFALLLTLSCSKTNPEQTVPTIQTTSLAPEAATAINQAINVVTTTGLAKDWTTLGLYLQAHGLHEEAISVYQSSIQLPNTPTKTKYYLAVALAKLGRYQDAIDACSSYTSYPPAFWRRGYWLIDLGRLHEATSMFDQAIALDNRAVAAMVGLARTHLQQNQPLLAITILEGIQAKGGSHPYLSYLIGTAYQRAGRSEDAANLLAKPTSGPPKWNDPWLDEMNGFQRGFAAVLSRATAKLDQGEVAEALVSLQGLSRSYPRHPAVLTNLATVQLQLGDIEAAIKSCGDSIRWNPLHAPSQMTMALSLMHRGDFQHASQYANKAITLQPANSQAHALAGKIALNNSKLENAAIHFEKSISIGSNNPADRELLGMICLDLRRYEEAIHQFELVISVNPASTRSIGGLAVALSKIGRSAKALDILREALSTFPQDQNLQRASQTIARDRSLQ